MHSVEIHKLEGCIDGIENIHSVPTIEADRPIRTQAFVNSHMKYGISQEVFKDPCATCT